MAVYHIVIEGVLALTGQKFILAWARNEKILPGFRGGFTAVARDESRHVAFGARVIRDLLAQDPTLLEEIHEGIAESLHLGTRLYQPPNGDVTYTSAFGYSLGDLFNYGGIQLEKKMRAIGIPMPDVDIGLPDVSDATWPPPGGGFIAVDWTQRLSMLGLRALTPRCAADGTRGVDHDALPGFRRSRSGGCRRRLRDGPQRPWRWCVHRHGRRRRLSDRYR